MRLPKHLIFSLLFLFFATAFAPIFSLEKLHEDGTLIITYHTDHFGKRLDRVRFWIINEKQERCLYPRGDDFVQDEEKSTRTVLIEQLPKGNYTLEFVYPNKDRLFEEIPPRTITMSSGGVVRIDQHISLNASLQVKESDGELAFHDADIYYEKPESEIFLPKTGKRFYSYPSSESHFPEGVISIKNTLPKARWRLHRRGVVLIAGEGEASDIRVPAGEGYYLESETFPDYSLRIYPSETFDVKPDKTVKVEIIYKRMYGNISIDTMIPTGEKIDILIEGDPRQNEQAIQATGSSINDHFEWQSKPLPAGQYLVTIKPPSYYKPISPFKIDVKRGQITRIRPKLSGARAIKVTANSPDAFYILKNQDESQTWSGQGYDYTFDGLVPGTYSLTFISKNPKKSIPPKSEKIVLSRYSDYDANISANYTYVDQSDSTNNNKDLGININPYKETSPEVAIVPLDPTVTMINIPEGESIIGDPFHDNKSNEMPPKTVYLDAFRIGKYEVTNGQYAAWLTKAVADKKINFNDKDEIEGTVKDKNNNILFYTTVAKGLSQIFATKESSGRVLFRPTPGKVDHPVIFVTWYGANLYCQESQCRLPTEAEWEKSAGMAPQNEKAELKKYRYGFSKDTIGRPWANYKNDEKRKERAQVLTTKVGYYNGHNFLPLILSDSEQLRTEDATSPIGAYDMSGNVWEWVSDWYSTDYPKDMPTNNPQGPPHGDKKVAKGGCYDSLSEGVRVAERMFIPPDHADEFTGFRACQ